MELTRSQPGMQLRTSPLPPSSRPALVSRPASTHGPQRAAHEPVSARSTAARPVAAAAAAAGSLDKRGAAPAQLTTLGFHQDASFLAVSCDGGYAVSRSPRRSDKTATPQQGYEDPHPDPDPDHTRVWDLKSNCVIWQGDLGDFIALAVAVDLAAGRYLFCNNRSMLVWPMDEQQQAPFTIDSGSTIPAGQACAVAAAADGTHAASYGELELRVWDLQQRRCVLNIIESLGGRHLKGVCVSADARFVVVAQAGPDQLLLLELEKTWRTSRNVATLLGKHEWSSFAVTPDRRHLVSAAAGGGGGRSELQLWELRGKNMHHVATLHRDLGLIRAVAVGADQRVLTITGTAGGVTELHVWDRTARPGYGPDDPRPWWQQFFSWLF